MIVFKYLHGLMYKVKQQLNLIKIFLFNSSKNIDLKNNFDDEFADGYWDYLADLNELAHYSIIVGYCFYWIDKPKILDVGCGKGYLALNFLNNNYSYYEGIDFSKEAMLNAKKSKIKTQN